MSIQKDTSKSEKVRRNLGGRDDKKGEGREASGDKQCRVP